MQSAEKNSAWIAMVRNMLSLGFGVEDIALKSKSKLEDVRREVNILRANGDLKSIYKRQ